ncbi:MAG TPA: plastocyanin/azurin family copper-binding protein [Solirubrobacterales bacterium]|jgi:plastocyanin|nr:plastocyanin/azurin family copper-binding protein [Solirubrobacterales bacterium]
MKKVAALLVLVLASVALVACGSSSSSSSSSSTASTPESGAAAGGGEKAGGGATGGSQALKVEADPNGQLAYTQKTLSAKAGNVTVDFSNPQALSHDVAIENSSGKIVGKTELVAKGSTSTAVNLKPGTYHYYCTVPGHREAGMEGTLTVK